MSADANPGQGTVGGAWAAVADELGPALRDAIGLFLSLRLVFGLFAIYLWWQGGLAGPCHFELARNGWATVPPLADQGVAFPLVGVWQRWDACWYTKIATYGYEAPNSVSFFPLFPLLTGLAGRILLGAMALGGLAVAGLAYVAAMTGLRRLVALDFDDEVARTAVVAISIFPTALFFFAPFTESLFLATAVWAILAARQRRWAIAAIAGLLAALTRTQGVFLVLPLGWEAVMAWREAGWGIRGLWRPPPGTFLRPMLAVLAPTVGFLAFLAFSAAAAGESPLDTARAWGGTNFHPPWEVIDASWQWAIQHHDPLQAFNLAMLILFALVTAIGLRQVPVAYSLFAIPQIALIGTRVQPIPLTSTGRYLLVVFPVFVILALVPGRWLRFAWAVASTMFLALLLANYLQGTFVA
jgi:mannosyltransferase PIG-V